MQIVSLAVVFRFGQQTGVCKRQFWTSRVATFAFASAICNLTALFVGLDVFDLLLIQPFERFGVPDRRRDKNCGARVPLSQLCDIARLPCAFWCIAVVAPPRQSSLQSSPQ